jgi:alpha-beta hydrolase superfamily lysophospholipase
MNEFSIPSAGGGLLRCGLWAPAGTPRGVVQLVHGIAEHIGRYDDFARFLTGNGFLVVAEDHMGHGKTAESGGTVGVFQGGWSAVVADVYGLFTWTRNQYPDLPYFLLGHSMGSFLARSFLITYPDAELTGAILSGTGQQPMALVRAGLAICGLEARRLGRDNQSDRIQSLIFGAYNKQFAPTRTDNDWICTDPAVVDAYEADPYSGFKPSIGMAADMLTGIRFNQQPRNLEKMGKSLPVLFFSGSEDPVGDRGKGVRQAAESFRKAGMQNIRVRLYEGGRHEMLNEKNKAQVYNDVLAWIEEVLPS